MAGSSWIALPAQNRPIPEENPFLSLTRKPKGWLDVNLCQPFLFKPCTSQEADQAALFHPAGGWALFSFSLYVEPRTPTGTFLYLKTP